MTSRCATWTDALDAVFDGDVTATLCLATPAGGVVLTPVAPIGLRDRAAGRIGFTTARGFGRKLDRLAADPRIALAFDTRRHSLRADAPPGVVIAQGRASVAPDTPALRDQVLAQATRHLGPPATGRFWDWWLQAYYQDRVVVWIDVERLALLAPAGARQLDQGGAGQPVAAPASAGDAPQPRVVPQRVARRLGRLPHRLVGWKDADGFPTAAPVAVAAAGAGGVRLVDEAGVLPSGLRRAGLVGHDYRPQLIGLQVRQHTGWLDVEEDGASYVPMTERGFRAPPNKTLLLLANGALARRAAKHAGQRRPPA